MKMFVAPRRAQTGVTLIELMVTVAIVGILAAIAYPSYRNSVVKTHRRAAETCLSSYAGFMERYYTTNMRYTTATNTAITLPTLDCASTSLTGKNYTYSFTTAPAPTAASYTLRAVPIGAQASSDTGCGTLTLDQTSARGVTGTSGVQACW